MARNHKQIKTTTMTTHDYELGYKQKLAQLNKQINTMKINGFATNIIAPCDAMGLSKCFEAYASIGEEIMEDGIGFNPNSGYVYIALENGISICSMLGREVEYLVTNFEDYEEYFFDTYEEAEAKWQMGSWNDYSDSIQQDESRYENQKK